MPCTAARAVSWGRAADQRRMTRPLLMSQGSRRASSPMESFPSGRQRRFGIKTRTLHFRVDGLAQDRERWTLLLHSFDHLQLGARYRVSIGKDHRPVGTWDVPAGWDAAEAFYPVELTRADFTATGRLIVHIESDQPPLVHWWKDGGFVAALHAFWIAG